MENIKSKVLGAQQGIRRHVLLSNQRWWIATSPLRVGQTDRLWLLEELTAHKNQGAS
jgi:hypothetical protein